MIGLLLPRETQFFDLLSTSANEVLEHAELSRRYITAVAPELEQRILRDLRRLHGEETTTQTLINRLNATFVTPIDREDIHDLAFRLDDVTKASLTAAERFGIFKLAANPVHERLADVLVACCKEMVAAVSKLGDTRRMVEVQQHCARIYQLEGEADEEMRGVLTSLYNEPVNTPGDVLTVIKRREVIDLQKRAIERCEWIADSLHNVAVKHA